MSYPSLAGAYIQDPTGAQVPSGKVSRTLVDWSPGWSAMPSTLVVDSGVGTVLTPSASTGQLKLSGATGSPLRLRLRTSADLDMSQYAEINWSVWGLYGSATTGIKPGISIENDLGTIGVSFYHDDADLTAKLRIGGGAPSPYSQYDMNATERLRHRNLTLQMRPPTGEVRILQDDQVVFEMPAASRPGIVLGLARCCVLTSATSTSQSLYLSRVKLTVVSD